MKTICGCRLLGLLAMALSVGTADCQGQFIPKEPAAGGAIILPDRPALTAEERLERAARVPVEPPGLRLKALRLQVEQRRVERMAVIAIPGAARTVMTLQTNGVRVEFVAVSPSAPVGGDDDLAVVEENPAPANSTQMAIAEHCLDGLLFGPAVNAGSARRQLEQKLLQRISAVDRSCKLTPEQQQKLQLAGRADIQRYFERVDEMREILRRFRYDMRDHRGMVTGAFEAISPAQALREVLTGAGPFGETSLFAKAMRKTLTVDQQADYELKQIRTIPETRARTLQRNLGLPK